MALEVSNDQKTFSPSCTMTMSGFGMLVGTPNVAVDFFVTAEHMADWVLPGQANRQARETLRASSVLLQVPSHVANGAKHFIAEARPHQSVHYADVAPAAFQSTHSKRTRFRRAVSTSHLKAPPQNHWTLVSNVRDLAVRIFGLLGQICPRTDRGPQSGRRVYEMMARDGRTGRANERA